MKKTVGVFSLIVMLLSQVFSPFAYALTGDEVAFEENVSEVLVPVVTPEVENPIEEIVIDEPSTGEVVEPVDVEVNTGTVISTGEETKNLEGEGTEASSGFIEIITESIKNFLGINGEEDDDAFESREIYGTLEYEGVKVEVYAQTGLFASGTELTIEPVVEEKLEAVQEVLLSGEVDFVDKQVIAFDITFRDPVTQEELQPKDGTVQVTFNYVENESLVQAEENEEQEVKIYHLNDIDEEGNKIEELTGTVVEEVIVNEEESEGENVMVVEAEKFSVYTIVVQVREEGPLATEDQLANFEYGMISIARPNSFSATNYPKEGFTIMDRNLGATTDDITNTGSYGYFYQWGNNYGFNPFKDIYYVNQPINVSGLTGYFSGTFVLSSNWMTPIKNLWGEKGQGPCPKGWHVPSSDEWQNLWNYYSNRFTNGGVGGFMDHFHIPLAGNMKNFGGYYFGNGYYWSSSLNNSDNKAYLLFFGNNTSPYTTTFFIGDAYPLRCFKNDYIPTGDIHTITFEYNGGKGSTASISVLSGGIGEIPSNPVKSGYTFLGWYLTGLNTSFDFTGTTITGDITLYAKYGKTVRIAGNDASRNMFTYGTIQVGDYVIMDRNLGATTNDITNTGSYGYYYQWGNNFGFSSEIEPTISNDPVPESEWTGKVSTYSSNIWRTPSEVYENSTVNDLLWGGKDGSEIERKGPCPIGYHVPSTGEWLELYSQIRGSGFSNLQLINLLKLPFAGLLLGSNAKYTSNIDSYGNYWSSISGPDRWTSYYFYTAAPDSIIPFSSYYDRREGKSVRCFQNSKHTVSFSVGGNIVSTDELVGGMTVSEPSINPETENGSFSGWYLTGSDTVFDFSTGIVDDTILYARWNCNNGYFESQDWKGCVEYTEATLYDGSTLNVIFKELANSQGNNIAVFDDDNNIKEIIWTGNITNEIISTARVISTGALVYAWYDDSNGTGTIYYYSSAEDVYLNKDSGYMFVDMKGLVNVDLTTLKTTKVTSLYDLFYGCTSLKTMDLSWFDVKNVTRFSSMFQDCTSLESVILDGWDFSQRNYELSTIASSMFQNTPNLHYISAKRWVLPPTGTYGNNSHLRHLGLNEDSFVHTIDVSNWDLSHVTSLAGLFNDVKNVVNIIGLETWDTSTITDMSNMFQGCEHLSGFDISHFDTSIVTNMSRMFDGCKSVENLDLSGFVTINTKEMSYMFQNCTSLKYINMDNWDTRGLTSFGGSKFWNNPELTLISAKNWKLPSNGSNWACDWGLGCAWNYPNKVKEIDVSNWEFEGTNLFGMFYGWHSLESIKGLETWNTSNVTNMQSMFYEDKNLKELNLTSFDTRNVTSASSMFYKTDNLQTIYVGNNFSIQGIQSDGSMFTGAKSLIGGYGTKYSSVSVRKGAAVIDTATQTGYFTDPNNFAVAYYTKQETPILITLEGNKKIGDHPNGLTQSHTTYQYYTGKDETTAVTLNTIDLKAYTELYVNIACDSDSLLIGTTCYGNHPITVEGSGSTINVTSVVKDKYLSGEQVELTVIGTPDGNISWSSTPSIAITSTNSGHTISFTMPDSNITLTPSMTLYHKVTYHSTANGGNATEDIIRENLVEGDSVDLTLEATKNDYSFEGWNTTQDSHETLSTLTMGTADIDLYPIFKKTISATFSGNGNTIANQQSEVVEECYRYSLESACSVVVPVIDNNAYTSIISGYSMNATTGSEIATIGTVTLDAATVAGGTASIDISDDITLYAQTYEPEVTYTVTYQKGEGDDARGVIDFVPYNDSCIIAAIYNGNNNVEQATGCEVELPTISIATGYHTPLWYKQGEDTSYSGTNIILTGDIILEAKVTANNYTVVYKPGEGTGEMESQEFEYDKEESLNKNKYRKEGYHFSGWIDVLGKEYRDGEKVLNLLTEGVLELTAQWLQNPPAAGGGQSITPATKEQEHNAAEEKPEDKQESNQDKQQDETVKDESKLPENTNTSNQTNTQQSSSTSSDNSYKTVVDPEIQSAYEWAYKHDVTTLPTLDEAMPDGVVKRGHLAKMVVNYATNILGRKIPEKIPSECRWNDNRKDWESEEIKDYAVKSCALGLMGLDMPKFLPNLDVTRAQFGTIMSRLLWGKKYAGGTPYYRKHLNALKENNIMTQLENPEKRVELRQWVWLMLMRSAENK